MSEPKAYLPMLNGLMLGEAISSHDGVNCYPAIRHTNQDKYILKVISVPASQVQLDAMLLTGAFPGREAAMEYYLDLSQDVLRETDILRQLSQQEGFLPYLDAQIVEKDFFKGYDVYLLSPFRISLEEILEKPAFTHKQVMRLSLDLCAALAVCRRAGYVYVDLKPSNIFHSEEQGYRIGDVGFAAISSLPYSSLPNSFRSAYSAPEMLEEMAVISDTADVYALGMVLYQVYNGGQLPDLHPEEPMPAPLYADYEFSEILLKACHKDPAMRWKDPMAMAQAMIAYLQKNPPAEESIYPADPEAAAQDEASLDDFLPEADPEELRREMEELDVQYPEEAEIPVENEAEENTETILAQVDELIAHPLPEPPVAPQPIDVPIPERISLEPEEPELPEQEPEPEPEPQPIPEPKPELEPEEPEDTAIAAPVENIPVSPREEKVRRPVPWNALVAILVVLALVSVALGGYYFYQNYYLQTVDALILEQNGNVVSVKVMGNVDNTLLSVVCSDSYGNYQRQTVVAGVALFQDLTPQTHYVIRLEISGWHKLTGTISDTFTTASDTRITQFTAAMGSADGSVLLQFSTAGTPNENWIISYYNDQHPQNVMQLPVQGNSMEISGLRIGAHYTFTLSRADGQAISGQTQAQFTASRLLLPENLTLTGFTADSITVQWQLPESAGQTVWHVHCYDEAGYSQRLTTTDLTATFTGISPENNYTVAVQADQMPQNCTLAIPADRVSVEEFHFSEPVSGFITLTWDSVGVTPSDGWVIRCTIDGLDLPMQYSGENNVLLPHIPGGRYTVVVNAVGPALQFGKNDTYLCPEAKRFDRFGITDGDLDGSLCLRPVEDGWTGQDVPQENYTDLFSTEQTMGLILQSQEPVIPEELTVALQFIYRDSEGNLIHESQESIPWHLLWNEDMAAIDLPWTPDTAGSYTVELYIDGEYVDCWSFSVYRTE
ncbi:MAG: hypothetical protein E7438_00670 [Ruminococcaceae bacterium]|nr:hypothetical protein [Oscillospiraceae bacterium]